MSWPIPKLLGVRTVNGFFGALALLDFSANGDGATFFPFGAWLVFNSFANRMSCYPASFFTYHFDIGYLLVKILENISQSSVASPRAVTVNARAIS